MVSTGVLVEGGDNLYRMFSIVVIMLSLLGGGYAGFELVKEFVIEEEPVDVELAKGYAATFTRAYLTVENGLPSPLQEFTDLPDQRAIDLKQGIPSEEKEKINQKVLGLWPVKTELLASNHMNVQVTAIVEREMPNKTQREQQENRLITYIVEVPITQGPDGYRVMQYPKLVKQVKDNQTSMPKLGTTDTKAEVGMRPMLVSFFKTYFEGQSSEDIANFFINSINVPSPQKGLFSFEEMNSVQAYPVEDNHWFVLINIRVKDGFMEMSYPFSYSVNVVRDGEKFYILNFNN